MPLISTSPSLTIEILSIDFVGPFPKPWYRIEHRYITTTIEYVTKWEKVEPVESYTKEVATKFIYENIIKRFGFPITLISDKGTYLINQNIQTLMKKYIIDHKKSSTYHPQANGAIESFSKTPTKGLTKIYNLE